MFFEYYDLFQRLLRILSFTFAWEDISHTPDSISLWNNLAVLQKHSAAYGIFNSLLGVLKWNTVSRVWLFTQISADAK